jgi:type VI secretion system protein ImpK
MSPRFAQYVDPIFMRVIDLLQAIDRGEQPAAERERRIVNDQLRRAESEFSQTDRRAWELAKYALVAWIDEMLLNSEGWTGRDWWLNNSMEWEHFRSAESHEMFFVKANEVASMPNGDDALETFYVCGMLGFRGFYGTENSVETSERVRLVSQKYDLPLDLSKWAGGIAQVIRERRTHRSSAKTETPERNVVTAQPMWSRAWLLWPWLLAVLCAGLLFVIRHYRQYF